MVKTEGIINIPMYREGEAPTTRPATQPALSSHYFSARSELLPSIYVQGGGSAWTDHVMRHTNPSWTQYTGFDPYSDAIGGLTPRFAHINRSAGTILNYYNPDDYALAAWKMDQALKPTESHSWVTVLNKKGDLDFGNASISNVDSFLEWWHATGPTVPIPGFADTQYVHNEDDNKFYRIKMKYVSDPLGGGFWELDTATSLSYAANPYEMFAFAASSRVAAIGRVKNMAGLGSVFGGDKNLSRLFGASFDDSQPGHSAEFVHSYLMIGKYWRQLVGDIQ